MKDARGTQYRVHPSFSIRTPAESRPDHQNI